MRSISLIRYGRRATSSYHELVESTRSFCSLTVLSTRSSLTSLLPNEHFRHGSFSKHYRYRRNTISPTLDSSSRRSSYTSQETLNLVKSPPSFRNFYIFFLILFLFIFFALVYSFIRMIKNSV